MSNLVLGTVQFGLNYGINNNSGKPDLNAVKEILKAAKDHGINELDTAQGYGDAEVVLRDALSAQERFLIHSKFSFNQTQSMNDIPSLLKFSLDNLGIEKLGYFFFHRFEDLEHFASSKKMDSSFVEQHSLGLGASIYSDDEFRFALNCNLIKAIQLPFNIFDCSNTKIELMREACQKGVKIYCRSVFLQGLFFMELARLPENLKKLESHLIQLEAISRKFQISKMSLALNFVKQFSEIDGVLIGVDNKQQLIDNLNAWKEQCPDEAFEMMRELVFADKELLMPKNWK